MIKDNVNLFYTLVVKLINIKLSMIDWIRWNSLLLFYGYCYLHFSFLLYTPLLIARNRHVPFNQFEFNMVGFILCILQSDLANSVNNKDSFHSKTDTNQYNLLFTSNVKPLNPTQNSIATLTKLAIIHPFQDVVCVWASLWRRNGELKIDFSILIYG